jgi:3-oxoadipate enol-lactonase
LVLVGVCPNRCNVVEHGTGAPVVLLHGLGCSAATWAPIAAELADRHRTIAVDLRGFGDSDAGIEGMSLADHAADVVAVLDRLSVPSTAVIGHSMGGMVAQELALAAPDRVSALVLCGTTAGPDPATRAQNEQLVEFVRAGGSRALAEAIGSMVYGPGYVEREPALVAEFVDQFGSVPAESLEHAMQAINGYEVSDRLGELRMPTLVYVGEHDAFLGDCRRIAAGIRGAQLVEIPSAGHMAPMEDPTRFAAVVDEFLAGVGSH